MAEYRELIERQIDDVIANPSGMTREQMMDWLRTHLALLPSEMQKRIANMELGKVLIFPDDVPMSEEEREMWRRIAI